MALEEAEIKKTDLPKHMDKKEKPQTKVVIRRLPPAITQETFLSQVSPIPEYNYIYTVKGDTSLGENSFSRVYINFNNPDDVFMFNEKFDNYVFVDSKGHEYPAVVEFAAFQKVPRKRGKHRADPKCGTIESDPVYLEFLESLKNMPTTEEKPEYCYQPPTEEKIDVSTPLLDYVKQRRIDRQRIRDEKREERKRKDLERKRLRDDERKKRLEEKSPTKGFQKHEENKDKVIDEKAEQNVEKEKIVENKEGENKKNIPTTTFRNRERKFDEHKTSGYKSKQKYKTDYYEKRDTFKNKNEYREREYKNKNYDDKRDSEKQNTKKIKKYSERREELKIIAKRNEEKQTETSKTKETIQNEVDTIMSKEKIKEPTIHEDATVDSVEKNETNKNKSDENFDDLSSKLCDKKDQDKNSQYKNKENDPRLQRRIRNKDRPTMAIYQPGMLRKKCVDGNDIDNKSKCSSEEKE